MSVQATAVPESGPPLGADGSGWLRRQRHSVINSLLGVILVVSLPAIVYTIAVSVRRGSVSFNGAYYLSTFVVIGALFLARRMRDGIRVIAILAVMYGFALLALYTGWLGSSGRGYLLCLILVSGLLIRLKVSQFAAALAALTYVGFGWAYASGMLTDRMSPVTEMGTILIEGVGFLLTVGIVVATQVFLERAIAAANRAEQEARQVQHLLDQRARQLQAANERLEELGRMKDEFVSNVSHELRSPISSMVLHMHLMSINPHKREAYLATLGRETERLAQIIESLLTLSRLDQARVEVKPTSIDLNTIAEVYVADRHALAESRQLRLELATDPGIPQVEADHSLIGQALGILLTNSLNYTPPGGSVTVFSRTEESQGRRWAGLAVLDTGPGIPLTEVPRLFERFFRGTVGRASGRPGTGLGLAIAKEIVDRHSGRLVLTRNPGPGQGTEFTLWLPVPTA